MQIILYTDFKKRKRGVVLVSHLQKMPKKEAIRRPVAEPMVQSVAEPVVQPVAEPLVVKKILKEQYAAPVPRVLSPATPSTTGSPQVPIATPGSGTTVETSQVQPKASPYAAPSPPPPEFDWVTAGVVIAPLAADALVRFGFPWATRKFASWRNKRALPSQLNTYAGTFHDHINKNGSLNILDYSANSHFRLLVETIKTRTGVASFNIAEEQTKWAKRGGTFVWNSVAMGAAIFQLAHLEPTLANHVDNLLGVRGAVGVAGGVGVGLVGLASLTGNEDVLHYVIPTVLSTAAVGTYIKWFGDMLGPYFWKFISKPTETLFDMLTIIPKFIRDTLSKILPEGVTASTGLSTLPWIPVLLEIYNSFKSTSTWLRALVAIVIGILTIYFAVQTIQAAAKGQLMVDRNFQFYALVLGYTTAQDLIVGDFAAFNSKVRNILGIVGENIIEQLGWFPKLMNNELSLWGLVRSILKLWGGVQVNLADTAIYFLLGVACGGIVHVVDTWRAKEYKALPITKSLSPLSSEVMAGTCALTEALSSMIVGNYFTTKWTVPSYMKYILDSLCEPYVAMPTYRTDSDRPPLDQFIRNEIMTSPTRTDETKDDKKIDAQLGIDKAKLVLTIVGIPQLALLGISIAILEDIRASRGTVDDTNSVLSYAMSAEVAVVLATSALVALSTTLATLGDNLTEQQKQYMYTIITGNLDDSEKINRYKESLNWRLKSTREKLVEWFQKPDWMLTSQELTLKGSAASNVVTLKNRSREAADMLFVTLMHVRAINGISRLMELLRDLAMRTTAEASLGVTINYAVKVLQKRVIDDHAFNRWCISYAPATAKVVTQSIRGNAKRGAVGGRKRAAEDDAAIGKAKRRKEGKPIVPEMASLIDIADMVAKNTTVIADVVVPALQYLYSSEPSGAVASVTTVDQTSAYFRPLWVICPRFAADLTLPFIQTIDEATAGGAFRERLGTIFVSPPKIVFGATASPSADATWTPVEKQIKRILRILLQENPEETLPMEESSVGVGTQGAKSGTDVGDFDRHQLSRLEYAYANVG